MNQGYERRIKRFKYLALVSRAIILFALLFGSVLRAEDPRTASREALVSDLTNLAFRAQDYCHRPWSIGGGQGSFTGLTLSKLTSTWINSNGTYTLPTVSATSVAIHGVGTQKGMDGNNVSIEVFVFADSMYFMFYN